VEGKIFPSREKWGKNQVIIMGFMGEIVGNIASQSRLYREFIGNIREYPYSGGGNSNIFYFDP